VHRGLLLEVGPGLCRILDMNFRGHDFPDVRE